jgi:hypothetical protein
MHGYSLATKLSIRSDYPAIRASEVIKASLGGLEPFGLPHQHAMSSRNDASVSTFQQYPGVWLDMDCLSLGDSRVK